MSIHEVENVLIKRGMAMDIPPAEHMCELEDSTIPCERLIGNMTPGSPSARLAWAKWFEESTPFNLLRAINVTAWRLRERDHYMAAWRLMFSASTNFIKRG